MTRSRLPFEALIAAPHAPGATHLREGLIHVLDTAEIVVAWLAHNDFLPEQGTVATLTGLAMEQAARLAAMDQRDPEAGDDQ